MTVKGGLKAYWDLFRLEHGLMMGLGVFIGGVAASPTMLTPTTVLKGFLVALLLEMAGFSLNDYFDYWVDLENMRFDRPLVRGDIERGRIVPLSAFLFILGLTVSLTINTASFFFAFAFALSAFLYSFKVKRRKYLGNQYIALTMAAPFVFGSLAVKESVELVTVLFASMAYLVGVGREIMKDVMDLEGDVKQGIKSIPALIGTDKSLKISSLFIVLSIFLSPIPATLENTNYYMNPFYILPVAATDLGLIYAAFQTWINNGKEKLNKLRKKTLMMLTIGLIGFLLGAVNM